MSVPSWYAALLLALAAFRTYRLIGRDSILDKPRKWSVGLPVNWKEGDTIPAGYRESLAVFWECGWCAGAWHAAAWWAAFQIWPHWTVVAAAPWAISAVVALLEKNAD